jgi:tetratricopeptide (TPR) repeat protein
MSQKTQRNVAKKSGDLPAKASTSAHTWDRGWILGIVLILATVIAYQQAWHAGYIWDDDVYLTGNKLLTAPDGLKRIWFSLESPSQYFPLVYTTFWIERALWGLNPAGYHCVNILLHILNALLVWRLLSVLRVPGAWLAAAIFALHPVQVESVAWITERKNVLMGCFFLLALLSWARFVKGQAGRMWKFYALALFFYALALLSKTTACTLPAALLLILWWEKKPISWQRFMQIAPFVALGFGMGLVSIWWERYHQGTQGEVFEIGLLERILIASQALWFYAGKLLWPTDLTFSYPRWTISVGNPFDYLWLLATAGFGAAVYFARRRVGRSVEVAALFFAATLAPTLGFVMLYTFRYSFVADHYQYLASLGPLALAAAGLTIAFDRLEKRAPFLRPVFCGALLLALGALTWRQCAMYRDTDTLWRWTISRNPRSWMAYNNIAISLQHTGRMDEALAYYNTALEANPDYGEGHYNLANALVQLGRVDEAVVHYEKALEINPNNVAAHYNLAVICFQIGKVDEAIAHYRKALEINPNHAASHNNLGTVLWQRGEVDEAVLHFRKALEIDPAYGAAQYNLGNILLRLQQTDEALIHFRKAIEIDPLNAQAHHKLANTLYRMGRLDEALAHYNTALAIDPQNMNALNDLAWLLATSSETRIRDGARAVELAERAVHLARGDHPIIIATLAAAYAEAGRFPDAVKTARRALDLANGSGKTDLADAIKTQLELYEASIPSRGAPNAPAR